MSGSPWECVAGSGGGAPLSLAARIRESPGGRQRSGPGPGPGSAPPARPAGPARRTWRPEAQSPAAPLALKHRQPRQDERVSACIVVTAPSFMRFILASPLPLAGMARNPSETAHLHETGPCATVCTSLFIQKAGRTCTVQNANFCDLHPETLVTHPCTGGRAGKDFCQPRHISVKRHPSGNP